MKFTFIFVDKTRAQFWQAAEAEYLKRLSRFIKYEIKIVPPVKNKTPEECLALESQKLLVAGNRADNFLIALDKSGEPLSSIQLAQKLTGWEQNHARLTFFIGGAYGLSPDLLKQSDFIWSLSSLTFTHEMARTILFEQLYRAFTINKNLPYHY